MRLTVLATLCGVLTLTTLTTTPEASAAASRAAQASATAPTAGKSSAIAPATPPALPDINIPYQKYVLPNGLTLIVHEDHKAPIVAVDVWYHVGSKDERPGRSGFAHLFEHLMFNGSENHNDEFM